MNDVAAFINQIITNYPWLMVCFAFLLGSIVGSYLNVCIYRLPLEKSLFWPGSRCGNCLATVRWYDNIPLISYIRLGGRCRSCGTQFSPRYFWIELLTGLLFAGLFYLEVIENMHNIGTLWMNRQAFDQAEQKHLLPMRLFVVWLCHSALVSLLIVATFTDIDHWEIPLTITIPGTILGIAIGTLLPWPWPVEPARIANIFGPDWQRFFTFGGLGLDERSLAFVPFGLQHWPVFLPLPEWLPLGSWQLGLATALVGAAVGTLGMRLIRLIFSWGLKKEAMGLGDADLMMMIGAFLGWQALIITLIGAVALGLVYAVILLVRNKGNELPFGPFLAGGAILALIFPPIYLLFQSLFFDLWLVIVITAGATLLALCLTLSIRMARLIWEAA